MRTQTHNHVRDAATLAFLFALAFTTTRPALAQSESVLYNFCSLANCTDGQHPFAAPVIDSKGNFYSTTNSGGASGAGTVFKLSPDRTETVLYSFAGTPDGDGPAAGLVMDKEGNFYGTTVSGGTYVFGGTVFKLSANGTETVLYSFGSTSLDGSEPYGTLVRDNKGNLYGTTSQGGAYGGGTVFEISATGTESILHSFVFDSLEDGFYPETGLIMDRRGNLYGTTYVGGAFGHGTAFRLAPDGTETILHSFGATRSDGDNPVGSLVMDKQGNLYGTTSAGGALQKGTVFKLAPNGTEWLLHSFDPKLGDGEYPRAGLLLDASGNLYGTTPAGGSSDAGIVFEIQPDRTETILHSFSGSTSDGATPYSNVVMDSNGNLYGTTDNGGTFAGGTLYKITPQAIP